MIITLSAADKRELANRSKLGDLPVYMYSSISPNISGDKSFISTRPWEVNKDIARFLNCS